ncbi:MAG: ethanolamine ammonia-lyase subunit EutB [Mariniblastus sp.]|nr:ethanolamine ammonia-lyase subunit EutB [Mariniblastus sp.]
MSQRPDTTGHSPPTNPGPSAETQTEKTTAPAPHPAWNDSPPLSGEGLFEFVRRTRGEIDLPCCGQILGAANPYKEGDESLGLAARDETMRQQARELIRHTPRREIEQHPVHSDGVLQSIVATTAAAPVDQERVGETVGELAAFLLESDGATIAQVMPSLSSDVIGCVVKLLDNPQLIQVARKVFNPLPGSQIGAAGYLGARVQPNSPTDHPDDIFWQVLDAWAYGVGDVLLGTNPVSSDPESVHQVERVLQDLLETFDLTDIMPHCVLSHIDVQAEVERDQPGSTELWFQSIAGTDSANQTFDVSVEKLQDYADGRTGPYAFYFETGQGADFTNGHGLGFDMVLHESRKYGLARGLVQRVAQARQRAGLPETPWIHVNDVAGFIGPEVFRTREQLVRCCLEDIVMGKLHGLCIGLDVCSTLHMDISLDDLDWCLEQIMPANPAYLMSLPTKIDPMLGYLTTGYQDHVRLRESFGYRVNDPMQQFFQSIKVLDADGQAASHFGDPLQVYTEYQRRKGDDRPAAEIRTEGKQKMAEVRGRGVFLAEGHGPRRSDLKRELHRHIHRICDDAKQSIWAELDRSFIDKIPDHVRLSSRSVSRQDYILHPTTGEQLSDGSQLEVERLGQRLNGEVDVQLVISDGLNALSIMEPDHLLPFLDEIREGLLAAGLQVSPEPLLVTLGRVRLGYSIGETLFAGTTGPRTIVHLIGERPGTGHRTFSSYVTQVDGSRWSQPGLVDHQHTRVISGIAHTALEPLLAARQTVQLLVQPPG